MRTQKFTWDDLKDSEAQAMKRGEFQGMVIQALNDIRNDVADLKTQNNITRYISFGIAGLSGIVSGFFSNQVK